MKDLPHQELTIAKGGPKLKESTTKESDDDPQTKPILLLSTAARTGSRSIVARGQTVDRLAEELSSPNMGLGAVLDKTGLTKKYDFTLQWALDTETLNILRQRGKAAPAVDAPPEFPDLPGALQQQLGLRIETKKGPIEVLVVDHCAKQPTEN
jgi:uncharacterized protein (TIGR03435 family)